MWILKPKAWWVNGIILGTRCTFRVVVGGNLGTGEFSWVFVKNIFESFIPFWRQCYAWVESYIYTCKLFYPIPRPLVHHSTETKYQSQRNPKHMSVDKNKASSTTVQPTYCPSFKNRLLWLVVICSFPTPFPVGLIPTMQGGVQAFPDDWQLSFLKNETKQNTSFRTSS